MYICAHFLSTYVHIITLTHIRHYYVCALQHIYLITLREAQNEKDIGVIEGNQSRFECKMYAKIKKANNMMGLIKRSFCAYG